MLVEVINSDHHDNIGMLLHSGGIGLVCMDSTNFLVLSFPMIVATGHLKQ